MNTTARRPGEKTVRLLAGAQHIPFPLAAGQTGQLLHYLGTKGLFNVEMISALFDGRYYQIPLASVELCD